MFLYTVKYQKIGSLLYHTLKKVKGDGLVLDNGGQSRWFILDDETRIEIPVANVIFTFSKERWMSIKERMDEEAGQDTKVRPR